MSQFEDQYHFINDTLDRAIETSLKEYETLRAEIAQRSQNIIQVVFLGLAAIATIISFTLPQFVNFVTSEDITIQSTQEDQDSLMFNLEILDNQATINVPRSEGEGSDKVTVTLPKKINLNLSDAKNNFKINRTTEATGAVAIKWIFVIVYALVLPSICLYVIHFVMVSARLTVVTQNYLTYEVEPRINNYYLRKDLSLWTHLPLKWGFFIKKTKLFTVAEYIYIYIFFAVIAFGSYNLGLLMLSLTEQGIDPTISILLSSNFFTALILSILIFLWSSFETQTKKLLEKVKDKKGKDKKLSKDLYKIFYHFKILLYYDKINTTIEPIHDEIRIIENLYITLRQFEFFLYFMIIIRLIEIIKIDNSSYGYCIIIGIFYQVVLFLYAIKFCVIGDISNIQNYYENIPSLKIKIFNESLDLFIENTIIAKIIVQILRVVDHNLKNLINLLNYTIINKIYRLTKKLWSYAKDWLKELWYWMVDNLIPFLMLIILISLLIFVIF